MGISSVDLAKKRNGMGKWWPHSNYLKQKRLTRTNFIAALEKKLCEL